MMNRPPRSTHRGTLGDDADIASALWRVAEVASERVAVVERGGSATYGELRARAAGVCRRLQELGTRPGDRVAMLLERGIEAVASYFGILASGAVAIVVNERLRTRQIEHVLRSSSASLLLSTEALLASQPRPIETTARLVAVDSHRDAAAGTPCSPLASEYAQIIFTSGSTGLPRGVVFTHQSLRQGASVVASYLGLTAEDRIASLLPLNSVYGLNQLLCAVTSGATLVVERSALPAQIEGTLRAAEATVVAAVPPLWLQLLRVRRFRDEAMPALRIMQNAGGHLPVSAVRGLRAAQPQARLFLQYGLTETFRSTYLAPDEVDRHPSSIGRSIPGADILVVRDDLTACDVGEVGELVHRGPTVAVGYWNDVEATTRVFRPDPQRGSDSAGGERVVFSGDLVRRDAEGLLYFVGRRDRMIKTLGHRVAPDEVAEVLFASGEVLHAVVAGEPDTERGERIVAYVMLAPSGSIEALASFCRRELPRHMQPSRFEAHPTLPRLASGKYDLQTLRAMSGGAPAPRADGAEGGSP
jgi:acyl-CoA synthetase (AMP-forming)/AMP-acid ligase II